MTILLIIIIIIIIIINLIIIIIISVIGLKPFNRSITVYRVQRSQTLLGCQFLLKPHSSVAK